MLRVLGNFGMEIVSSLLKEIFINKNNIENCGEKGMEDSKK